MNRFVTTMRTQPGRSRETLYLIRSYDHEERNDPSPSNAPTRGNTTVTSRNNTGRTNTGSFTEASGATRREARRSDTINHGKAQKFEVWEVARAATAAKFYFKPLEMVLPGSIEHMIFEDGGFGKANNPTLVGTHELEDLYGHKLGIIVSVGTARKDEENKKGSFFLTVPRFTRKAVNNDTDPEAVHKSMDRKANESSLSYSRLNDPGKLGVELDEWEPKKAMFNKKKTSGSTTLSTIEGAFGKWASDIDNVKQLANCAAALVKCRRARIMDGDVWERFATGATFTCPARSRKCDGEDFFNRTVFREHLREKHPERRNSQGQEERACINIWRYQGATQAA